MSDYNEEKDNTQHSIIFLYSLYNIVKYLINVWKTAKLQIRPYFNKTIKRTKIMTEEQNKLPNHSRNQCLVNYKAVIFATTLDKANKNCIVISISSEIADSGHWSTITSVRSPIVSTCAFLQRGYLQAKM